MNNRKFVVTVISIPFFILLIVGTFNYFIDPYGIYQNSNIFNLSKVFQSKKNAQIKIVKTKMIKPVSIVLGSSRAEFGYDPNHDFF